MPARSIVLLAAVTLLAACGSPSSTPAATGSPEPTASPAVRGPILLGGVPMTPCTVRSAAAVCGTLTVPEDRSRTGGRQIDLRVAVLPATGPTVRSDPVVFLDGGPGGAATEDFGWVADVMSSLRVDRDIVLVDQRGTSGSNRLVASAAPDVSGLPRAEAEAKVRAWVAQVVATLPGDPRFYTTSVAMDDVDDVRAALGADLVNLVGPSYGATAAQYYLRQHGEHVRTAVFDGGTLVDVPIFERLAASSQRALDIAFARCGAEPACATAFPDLDGDLTRALGASGAVRSRAPSTIRRPASPS